jgi:hypothetical protein
MPLAAGKGHAFSSRLRRPHAATILSVLPEEREAEPDASGAPAESAGPLLAPAPPGAPAALGTPGAQGAPAALAAPESAAAEPGGPGTRSTRARLLGWVAGTGFIIGVAWLLTSLISSWTTYPTLAVTTWSTLTYGPGTAQIYFLVTNTGTGAATGCHAHLQLGNGQIVTMNMADISVNGSEQNYLRYTEAGGAQRQASYLWTACNGGQSPRKPVATVGAIALVTAQPQVSRAGTRTTVTFRLRNLGPQAALSCRAFARLGDITAAGSDLGRAALAGHSAAPFTVAFKTGGAGGPGHPIVAWAQCLDPSASGGFVISNRSYISTKAPPPPR